MDQFSHVCFRAIADAQVLPEKAEVQLDPAIVPHLTRQDTRSGAVEVFGK